MLFDIMITVLSSALSIVFVLLGPVFALFPDVAFGLASSIGYIFGNIMLLNGFLPVTDLFVIGGLAIAYKSAFIGYDIFLFVMEFTNAVKRTFISYRG